LLLLAVREGHTFIVGVGGDGTHHDLVNALVVHDLLGQVTYAPLPLGSGNDWCRTLGIPRHILRWIEVIKKGNTIDHRIGKLTYEQGAGPQVRYFINVAGLAYDAEVVRRSGTLPVRHRWMYPFLTLAYLKGFTQPELELRYDGQLVTGRFHTINLGIGRYNGGGMRLVPQADPTADTLALTYARNLPTGRIIANGWRFYTDTIGRVEGVTTTHARHVTISGATRLEADGELLGTAPVTAALIPRRLRVICGSAVGLG
jgi:diacylglycerol kinase family enzyme